jgi:hypothetical protein
MSIWALEGQEIDKDFDVLGAPTYLLTNGNAYDYFFSTLDRKLGFAFGLLTMIVGNDMNNKIAISGGLGVAINTVLTNEVISEDSVFGKAFVSAVGCLVLSARDETMVVQFINF